MGKALVIVESPSKAKIINGYLGDDYIVKASVGHIRDLPNSASSTTSSSKAATPRTKKTEEEKRSALFTRMGVDPTNHWQAHYEIMPDKEHVVKELKKIAKDCDAIYLATDLDREGEAIAWHLREVLQSSKNANLPFWRVKYPEITKAAIHKAFANPGQINMDLVNAQQTRRFLDRVVGFMVSPLLWEKVGRGLSAGRVQSVAVELIVDRERAIKAFVPQEYWTIVAHTVTANGEALDLNLALQGKNKVQINNATEAAQIMEALKVADYIVEKVEAKRGKAHAPAPFTTSTLQQSANQRLGFSVKRTMTIAQHLYESGFITYMRTDSVNLSQEAIDAARNTIAAQFGPAFVPEKPNYYQSKESAQEAHEAIRPSHPNMTQLPASRDRDEQRLYQLIYERYLACQMSEQVYETLTITVKAGDFTLRANGRRELFPGFRAVLGNNTEDTLLPQVQQGEQLGLAGLTPTRHFTQPPARFTEATLVKELEKDGIGRPSTYASIIATIQDRGYVKVERNRFFATKMGEIVTDRLRYSFANLMDFHFTASMEESLDEIAAGKRNWLQSLDEFYADFSAHLSRAQLPYEQGGMPNNRVIPTNLTCPSCGKYHLGIQMGRTGTFLSCLSYHDQNLKAKDRCRFTLNLIPINEQKLPEGELNEAAETALLLESKRCPKCGSTMDAFLIDRNRKLYVCSNAPMCDGYLYEEGDFSAQYEEVQGPTVICEKCGHEMTLREGRFGKYMKCTNEECGNTRKILKNGEVAPPREDPVDFPELVCEEHKDSHYVLRDGASGLFLAAHNFPAVRETRPVKVEELQRFASRLPPKFIYLTQAPARDEAGNLTEVRYSRKTKTQYVTSVTPEGKPTTWAAYFNPETQQWEVGKRTATTTRRRSTSKSTAEKAAAARAKTKKK
ncbi:MAG: type I DNA topoisomerase [Candidatus Anaerobiospirillum pullicola]|uniref:DNA topoisomerase 1 n=1 Tax=Candidatus Anaerobiospirillum pullicola TaxID=2838451 RepID=A0A948WY43_9GAMM|nr:type I DNA topoisomerase [Candidatus Anaerobiospirillum pullicola]